SEAAAAQEPESEETSTGAVAGATSVDYLDLILDSWANKPRPSPVARTRETPEGSGGSDEPGTRDRAGTS
ncbi:MAG TPA: hypothetical protein VFT74_19645, partial [Isosphaeraceae bacterium]|nr:hypothetical protein [Isosphaeraceae bacterium]